MPEFGELAAVSAHKVPNDKCPFCPGKKEKRTTYPGAANSSETLRDIMNDPGTLTSKQSSARPKDGKEGRQSQDKKQASPDPIFRHKSYGDYGDQAHHAISGNEILKGHAIEKLIVAGSEIEADTGYSVNNCANGVYLPAYPRSYRGTWSKERPDLKLAIMKLPMQAGKGQAHIGSHKDHLDPGQERFHRTYPEAVKEMLDDLVRAILPWAAKCPLCKEKGKPKKPYPAPYRINGYFDAISAEVIGHVTAPPEAWTYFISSYAKDFHAEVCPHGTHKKRMKSALKAKRARR